MNEIMSNFETLGNVLQQHQLQVEGGHLVPAACLGLIFGVGISVLGAKLARPAFVLAFAAIGGLLGVQFAQFADMSSPLCALVSSGLVAFIGYITFRLWVGVGVAMVLGSIAYGGFGVLNLLPLVPQFQEAEVTAMTTPGGTQAHDASSGTQSTGGADAAGPDSGGFAIPAPRVAPENVMAGLRDLGRKFWAFATEQQPQLTRYAQAIGLGTLIIGVFIGVLLVRWSLVAAASTVGTAMVMTSSLALMSQWLPSAYTSLIDQPAAVGITATGFFLTSVILQGLLTREAKSDDAV